MQKVRWTQKCRGGCGLVLHIGVYATWLHGGPWCLACAEKHKSHCFKIGANDRIWTKS